MAKWFGGKGWGSRSKRTAPRASYRPGVEGLEERALLAAPAVSLPLGSINVPVFVKTSGGTTQYFGKTVIVPIVTEADAGKTVSYQIQQVDAAGNPVTTENPNFTVETQGGNQYLRLTVEYTVPASGGNPAQTKTGVMEFELLPDLAPQTVARFVSLANSDYFDNTIFHRVAVDSSSPSPLALALQAGNGASGTTTPAAIDDEFARASLFTGSGQLALAKTSADDSGTAQFFITTNGAGPTASTNPQRDWDLNYPIFGQLVRGFDIRNELVSLPRTVTTTGTAVFTNSVTIKKAEVVTNTTDEVIVVRASGAPGQSVTYKVTASDGSDTGSQTFTVTSVSDTTNNAPFLSPVPTNLSTKAGQPITITLTATDLEGDTPIFTATVDSPTGGPAPVINGNQITVIPPHTMATGTLNLTVRVTDAANNGVGVDTQAVKIAVTANAPPVFGAAPAPTGIRDNPVTFGVTATDADNDPLTYSVVSVPSGFTSSVSGNQITLTPPAGFKGTAAVTVAVKDFVGGQDNVRQTVNVRIYGVDPNLSADEQFLIQSYRDILGREPDASGRDYFMGQMAAGKSHQQVASAILNSEEGRSREIDRLYQQYLGRAADEAGRQAWLQYLSQGGTMTRLRAMIVGSDEFYQRTGGSDRNFLSLAYFLISGQGLDATTQQTYASLLASGTPRNVVAYRMMTSTAGWQGLVGSDYQDVLNRSSDTAGSTYFVNLLEGLRREEEVRAEMYGSTEYQGGIL